MDLINYYLVNKYIDIIYTRYLSCDFDISINFKSINLNLNTWNLKDYFNISMKECLKYFDSKMIFCNVQNYPDHQEIIFTHSDQRQKVIAAVKELVINTNAIINFINRFGNEITEDQQDRIDQIRRDMCKGQIQHGLD